MQYFTDFISRNRGEILLSAGNGRPVLTRQARKEKLNMTRFEALKAITDVDKFADGVWHIVRLKESPEDFAGLLKSELSEEELQLFRTAVRDGSYPLSLELLQ